MHTLNVFEICANRQYDSLDEDDKILIAQMQATFMEKKRRKLLEMHPFGIGYNRSKGLYYTYFEDDTRKNHRRQVTRKSRKDIEELIIQSVEDSMCVKVEDVFEDFLNRKIKNDHIKKATVMKYRTVFKRHYVTTGWAEKDIRKITVGDFIDFMEDEIGGKGLDPKATSNFRGVTKGIIRRAKNRGYIDYNYSDVLDSIEVRPRRKRRNHDKERFSKSEVRDLIEYLCDNPTVTHLALLFMLVSGLRVGEMSTLRFDDFLNETTFNVRRTETIYRDDDGRFVYEVSDTTKTLAGERTTSIPHQYAWIVGEIKKQRPFATYLCTNQNGERMTSQCLRSRLYRVCDALGMERKSCHKLRKTFASVLIGEGCNTELIKEVMGHTDISTTNRFYNFNRGTDSEKQNMLDNIVEFQIV